MSGPVSHDQNFKNLILDYPRQALAFFAPGEAGGIDDSVRITPIRQEQLKSRLGDRFHELDVPLLVEWPDGRREALLFLFEEESDPARFSIHRLGRYCLDLAELCRGRKGSKKGSNAGRQPPRCAHAGRSVRRRLSPDRGIAVPCDWSRETRKKRPRRVSRRGR
ncbi:hypothetical protein [Pseudothauera nasutitermitis]|uniref:hypothetical protein n=1 Tax=Pseudothauera nasutitermitis TaxID=2565930 RepID=UPI001B3B2C9B|nr:hypothetical protein [Pseudothauera nasutitermitis]